MSFQIFDVCEICGTVAVDGFDNDAVSPMCDECLDVEDDECDGQPSEYDEWQDYYGGDDWDQGQYDEF